VFTSLTHGSSATEAEEDSQVGVSSLMDTWLLVRNLEFNGERNRTLHVLKSRGMAHSNQGREFVFSSEGLSLMDVYVGNDRVFTGTARVTQEAREKAAVEVRQTGHEQRKRQLAAKRKALEAQIAALRAEAEADDAELEYANAEESAAVTAGALSSQNMARLRGGRNSEKSRRSAR
ncbi:MAG: KaiC 1, partial [Chthoniobacteraceae bacterium]